MPSNESEPDADLIKGDYAYTSVGGSVYNLRLSASHAAAGGFTAAEAGNPNWGRVTRKNMPWHVTGKSDGGRRARVMCPSSSAMVSKVNAGEFTLGGVTFHITGYHGECVSN